MLVEIFPYFLVSAFAVYLLAHGCRFFLNQIYYPSRYSEKYQRMLLMKTLQKLGCQYELEEDKIRVIYAEKQFVLKFGEQVLWIHYYCWGKCDLSTTPPNEVTRIKEAINLVNQKSAFHIVHTIAEGNILCFHSLRAVYFVDAIPNTAAYLQSTFDALLQCPHLLQEKINESNEQQTQKRIKIKGFSNVTTNGSVDESDVSTTMG